MYRDIGTPSCVSGGVGYAIVSDMMTHAHEQRMSVYSWAFSSASTLEDRCSRLFLDHRRYHLIIVEPTDEAPWTDL